MQHKLLDCNVSQNSQQISFEKNRQIYKNITSEATEW